MQNYVVSSLHLPLFCRWHPGKRLSRGLFIPYMQDTGDIIIRRWPGCEATIVPTGRPWNRISVARGPSLLQLFPKALTLTRPNLLGPLVTISWLPRTRTAGLHIPEGLGSIHQPAQENGARENAELGPPRRRRSPSQTGAWSAT